MVDVETINSFHHFVQRSHCLLGKGDRDPRLAEFQAFIQRAKPLLLANLRAHKVEFHRRVALLSRWYTPHDLLQVARLNGDEDRYTRLIGWALDPPGHPNVAQLCQKAWLRALDLDTDLVDRAVRPRVQFYTDDGIPDLVLDYGTLVVIVEAKTGTTEHQAPSGLMQTEAYPSAIGRALNAETIRLVYLTPDGDLPANPSAIPFRYIELVLALAGALDGADIPADLRWAYTCLFSHLISVAVSTPMPWSRILDRTIAAIHLTGAASVDLLPGCDLDLTLRAFGVLMKGL